STGWNASLESTVSLRGDPTIPPPEPTVPSFEAEEPTRDGGVRRAEPYERVTDDEAEKRRILDALEKCLWNQTAAPKMLGIARQTLVTRRELFNLPRPRKRG